MNQFLGFFGFSHSLLVFMSVYTLYLMSTLPVFSYYSVGERGEGINYNQGRTNSYLNLLYNPCPTAQVE